MGYRLLIIFKSNQQPFQTYYDIVGTPWPATDEEAIDYTRGFEEKMGAMYSVSLYEGERLIPHTLDKTTG